MKIAPGWYHCKIVTSEMLVASTGTPYLEITMKILVSARPKVVELLPWKLFLSEKALPYSKRALAEIGFDGADLASLSGVETQNLKLHIVEEKGQKGGSFSKIAKVIIPDKPVQKVVVDEKTARELQRRMSAVEPAPPVTSIDEDEVFLWPVLKPSASIE